MSHPPFSVLIVDDDVFSSALLREELSTAFPEARITCRDTADVSGTFDVYLLDNDFHGSPLAVTLTASVRLRCPDALLIVFSSLLERDCLKALLNAGCDAVAEKCERKDRQMTCDLVRRYIAARNHAESAPRPSVLAAAGQLLREWNRRLELSRDLEAARA